jgi:broad specificity phosphatase PhoE
MLLLLVRHGETEWSRSGQHTSHTDLPLTETGRRQGELLAGPLQEYEITRVLTSPLARALDTCKLAGMGDRAEVREELVEWDYGDYEGRTTPDIREERPGWLLWRDGCPGGETADQVGARVDRVLDEIRSAPDATAALFAHGHVLRVLTARWLGLPPEAGALFALSTATLSTLGYERETAVIRSWNLSL